MRLLLQTLIFTSVFFLLSAHASPLLEVDAATSPSADFKKQVLDLHNTARKDYGAQALTWSDSLYTGAKQWANQCKFQTSGGTGAYGENIAAGYGGFTMPGAVQLWMNQASKYAYNKPGFSTETGAFTQVVWKSSTQVACAISNCPAGTMFPQASVLIGCRYKPAGNVIGQFPANVGRRV